MNTRTPVSGTELAKALGVSRQIIVQDIALLRARNREIISTNKGYLLFNPISNDGAQTVVMVKHNSDQVYDEFATIVELGGRILDVSVEHELYGPIRADLLIENAQDAQDFVDRLNSCRDNPLKVLTDDCHYHTVTAPSEKLLDLIEAELRNRGFLES